jgi:class 3 adenylate cyclase
VSRLVRRLVQASVFVLLLASRLLVLAIGCVALAWLLGFFDDVGRIGILVRFLELERAGEKPVLHVVEYVLPTRFRGSDVSRPMLALLLYVVSALLARAAARVQSLPLKLRRVRAKAAPAPAPETMDRAELLEVLARAKKSLDQHKRHRAFLSIDVVDSTGLKVDEAPELAERDFRRYKALVQSVVKAHGELTSAWTPDGVMICFRDAPSAVRAAQDVLRGLDDFNRRVKVIKRGFSVRIGIHAGDVFHDPGMRMEEMTDRVVDIAGHLQKHGAPNAISISRDSIAPHLAEFEFTPTGRIVDGCEVYEWRSRSSR